MIKRFARPAAGTEIDAAEVRTPSALAAVAAHLVTAVPADAGGDALRPYEFVADRLRAVLQDATVQVRGGEGGGGGGGGKRVASEWV
jgi:hypothetical protein